MKQIITIIIILSLIGLVSAVTWTTPSDVYSSFDWGSDTSYFTYGGIDFSYGSADHTIAYIKPKTNSAYNTTLLFGVSSALGIADIMALDGISGNVGIGTTAPTHKLNVVGSVNITGNATYNSYYGGMWFHDHTGIPIEWNDTYQKFQFENATNLNGFSWVGNKSKLMNTNGNGMYQVHWNAVGTGTNNHIYHGAIFVNEVEQENTIGHATGDGNGEVRIDSFGFIYLNTNDNVTMRGRDVGGTTSGTAIFANINLVRIGN